MMKFVIEILITILYMFEIDKKMNFQFAQKQRTRIKRVFKKAIVSKE